jgi:hypothetical protein
MVVIKMNLILSKVDFSRACFSFFLTFSLSFLSFFLGRFLRHMRKTAQYNGGIRNIFANLDYDGDGLISYYSLMKFFRSEDFFEIVSEDAVDILLKPFMTKDKKSLFVVTLIQWLTGEKGEPKKIILQSG